MKKALFSALDVERDLAAKEEQEVELEKSEELLKEIAKPKLNSKNDTKKDPKFRESVHPESRTFGNDQKLQYKLKSGYLLKLASKKKKKKDFGINDTLYCMKEHCVIIKKIRLLENLVLFQFLVLQILV